MNYIECIQNLTVLDLGFNNVGDEGCKSLSFHMVAGNHTLRNLFLSGNNIKQKGAVALASAILHGCTITGEDPRQGGYGHLP